jgi:hypothetical protein
LNDWTPVLDLLQGTSSPEFSDRFFAVATV